MLKNVFKKQTPWVLVLLPVLAYVVGWLLTGFLVSYGEKIEKSHLEMLTVNTAASLDPNLISQLKSDSSEERPRLFEQIRNQLIRIRKANPEARFVYLLEANSNKVTFLADAEPLNSVDYSAPGDIYADAPSQVYSVISDGQSLVGGPFTDSWGTWVTGYSPVLDPESSKPIAVFAIDIEAGKWLKTINGYRRLGLVISGLIALISFTFLAVFYYQGTLNNKIHALNQILENELNERSRAEGELRESEERYRRLSNATFEGVVIIENNKIIDANNAFINMVNYSRDEIIGTEIQNFVTHESREDLARHLELDYEHSFELDGYKKGDITFPVKFYIRKVNYKSRDACQIAIRNLTQIKEAEKVRIEHEKLQGVLEMAGAICHELNQPLMALAGYLELLEIKLLEADKPIDHFEKITKQLERINTIITRLQYITKYETMEYARGSKIIDIEKSSEKKSDNMFK